MYSQCILNLLFLYFVMEYVSQLSLWNIMQQGLVMSTEMAREYFRRLVEGLYYCHNTARIAHKCISLQNIYIRENEDYLKLVETGVLFMIKNEGVKQSAEYDAPEITGPEFVKNFQTDIWSLGVCLYFMVEGHFPFNGDNPEEIHCSAQTLNLNFSAVSDKNLINLLEMMLNKDPSKRIALIHIKAFKSIIYRIIHG